MGNLLPPVIKFCLIINIEQQILMIIHHMGLFMNIFKYHQGDVIVWKEILYFHIILDTGLVNRNGVSVIGLSPSEYITHFH